MLGRAVSRLGPAAARGTLLRRSVPAFGNPGNTAPRFSFPQHDTGVGLAPEYHPYHTVEMRDDEFSAPASEGGDYDNFFVQAKHPSLHEKPWETKGHEPVSKTVDLCESAYDPFNKFGK